MAIKIQIEIKNQDELEMLHSGLRLSADDAREYHSACTPENNQDREDLKYWDKRAILLNRLMQEVEQARSIE